MGKTPKIRFKGFSDDWEQRKLSEVATMHARIGWQNLRTSEFLDSGDYLLVTGTDFEDGRINYATCHYVERERYEQDKHIQIENGSILITKDGTLGKVAYVQGLLMPATLNAGVFNVVIKDEKVVDGKYLFQYLKAPFLMDYVDKKATGGTIKHLNRNILVDFPVVMPCVDEQALIGAYFDDLDNLITLHQRKCDILNKTKKFMLQKMFPKNNATKPEIRFSGFIDDWEQRKLEDWGTFYYGHSCPKWSVTADATTPCIRYGELYTKFGTKIDRVFSYTNMPTDKLRFSKGTEVLIPRVGEDPMDYNHCTWLSMPGVAIGEMISVFNTEQNPLFAATMFNATLQKEFAMRVEGGSVTNLYFEKLKNIETSFPKIEEQEKIARFFEELDTLITLHQRKCENLKTMKKFMLKNMFI